MNNNSTCNAYIDFCIKRIEETKNQKNKKKIFKKIVSVSLYQFRISTTLFLFSYIYIFFSYFCYYYNILFIWLVQSIEGNQLSFGNNWFVLLYWLLVFGNWNRSWNLNRNLIWNLRRNLRRNLDR